MANTLKNIVDFNSNISTPSNQQPLKAEDLNSSSLIIECDEILKLIPHRYPMLLIDRVKDVKLGESAVGIKNVSMNEQFFQGHFPAKPIMPGVLIIEAMAQTAAVLVVKTMGTECADKLVYFMSVEEARFRKPVTPGDQLELKVTKIKERGLIWKFKGEAYVAGQLTDEAIFTAMIVENNNQ